MEFPGFKHRGSRFQILAITHYQATATKKMINITSINNDLSKFDCSMIFTRGFTVGSQKWMFTYQAHAEGVIFAYNTVEQGSWLQIKSLRPFSIELKNLHIIILPIKSD